jgi:DNA repair protein RecO (recombination protein O)
MVSTILRGALRTHSPFADQYALFSTSELHIFQRLHSDLFIAKECALLTPRDTFRTEWKSMQAASYITALYQKVVPERTTDSLHFMAFETHLDQAATEGNHPAFLIWFELAFARSQGNEVALNDCIQCGNAYADRFAAAQGGMVCQACAKKRQWMSFPIRPDIKALLRTLNRIEQPNALHRIRFTPAQLQALHTLTGRFIETTYALNPSCREAAYLS